MSQSIEAQFRSYKDRERTALLAMIKRYEVTGINRAREAMVAGDRTPREWALDWLIGSVLDIAQAHSSCCRGAQRCAVCLGIRTAVLMVAVYSLPSTKDGA